MTGYTHKMVEDKQTFPQFAMSCARAFGALIEMRDESMDAPVPDKLQPDAYHARAMAEASAEYDRLSGMTEAQRLDHGRALRDQSISSWTESGERVKANRGAMTAMLVKVDKWHPPTKEHHGLHRFMREQLTESLKWETDNDEYLIAAQAKTASQYFDDALQRARENISHHKVKYDEEVERTNQRNAWLRALRESLKE